ncbi:MAG TPA: hypothetical protein GX507_05800 [Clostridia bacterium]|nr:hypothetical protein [Clostridia bacterium]
MATGAERVRAAFKRTFSDTVPAYPIVGCFTAKLIGASPKQYFRNPATFAESQLAACRRFDPDIVVMMADLLIEAEALGAGVEFPEDAVCYLTKSPLSDDPGLLVKMEIPDPKSAARMPYYLEACHQVTSSVKDRPVGSTLVGPWAIAAHLRGIENIIFDTVDRPEYVRELMNFTTQVAKAFGDAVVETGAGLSYSEATVSCSVISPKIYREFVKAHHVELIQHFKAKRVGVTLHVCGFIDPIMEDLIETGANAISIDSASSLEKMVEVSQKRTVIIGNVPTTLFQEGTEAQMREAVKKCIDIAASHSAYILSSGCEVPPTAPVESVEWFMKAAREFGKYEDHGKEACS